MTCCRANGDKAANTFGRFVINSTVGVAGLIDVAGKIGIPGNTNDFGITLGKAGAAEGSYLVLPLLGPKPPRDLVGMGVDIGVRSPHLDRAGTIPPSDMIMRGGLSVLDERAANCRRGGVDRALLDRFLRHHPQPLSPEPRRPDQ